MAERSADRSPSPRIEPGDRPAPPRSRAEARPPAPPRRPRKPGRGGAWAPGGWRRRLLGWTISAAILLVVAVGSVVGWYALNLPSIDSLTAATRRPSVTVLSADGQVIAATGDVYGDPLTLKEMARDLPEAVIATEDRRFYSHFGIDPIGLARAAFADLRAGHVVEGGSTLTQQLAKNLFLTPDRTMGRKIQEVLLALELERTFSKDQILTLYLNRVYLGNGIYGVDAAAHRYFGTSARQLSLYQCALIAGLLKAPSRYNPDSNPDLSRQRTAQVLQNMVEVGDVTRADADAALAGGPASVVAETRAGRYFVDWAIAQSQQYASLDKDLVIHTTLDLRLQRQVEAELDAALDGPGAKADISQGAVVVMSPDGAIRALVGGRDYAGSQFNRATQAMRQPGSSFKAFLYLAAMEQGWTPDAQIEDSPITAGKYRPRDFERDYEGMISLRHAFAKSSNVAAVRLIEAIGPRREIAVARALGITSPLADDASLALGTSVVTPLELTSAYATFANEGNQVFAYGIVDIHDAAGHVVYDRRRGATVPVVPAQDLAEMDDLMGAVIADGTGKAARLDRPAAGKTGTTQDSRDAWFVGFTADYVTGVWLGNDDNSPMKRVTGGALPAELWHTVMTTAEAGLPPRPLPLPIAPAAMNVSDQLGGSGATANPVADVWHSLVKLLGG